MTFFTPPALRRSPSAVCGALALTAAVGLSWQCAQEDVQDQKAPPPAPTPVAPELPRGNADLTDLLPEKRDKIAPQDIFKADAGSVGPKLEIKHPILAFEELDQGLPQSGTWIGYPLLADFTGDGRADLVASNREEDGYNAWEAPVKGPWLRHIDGLPRDMAYGPARAADLDGDGHLDLILSAHTDGLRVYLNDGKMSWKRGPTAIVNPVLMIDVAVGNLNGDGKLDCVGVAHFEGGISAFLGDGKGGFDRLDESGTIMTTKSMGRIVELADFDGDGLDDIAATTNFGLKVWLTRSGETMRWEEISAGLPNPSIGNSLMGMKVGRVRAGGRPQLIVCMVPDPNLAPDKRNTIGVYDLDLEQKKWTQIDQGLPRGDSYRDVGVADLDGDGHLDLVTLSLESGGVVWDGDGKGGFKPRGNLRDIRGRGRIAIGDVDLDKRLDIVLAIPATKENPELGGLRCFLNRAPSSE